MGLLSIGGPYVVLTARRIWLQPAAAQLTEDAGKITTARICWVAASPTATHAFSTAIATVRTACACVAASANVSGSNGHPEEPRTKIESLQRRSNPARSAQKALKALPVPGIAALLHQQALVDFPCIEVWPTKAIVGMRRIRPPRYRILWTPVADARVFGVVQRRKASDRARLRVLLSISAEEARSAWDARLVGGLSLQRVVCACHARDRTWGAPRAVTASRATLRLLRAGLAVRSSGAGPETQWSLLCGLVQRAAADEAWCAGIGHVVIHRLSHQPHDVAVQSTFASAIASSCHAIRTAHRVGNPVTSRRRQCVSNCSARTDEGSLA